MLLEAFVGMEVVLELKTDAQVLGYVEWADGGMKCVPPHSLCAADDRADFGVVANWPARQWSECRLHARMYVCTVAGRGVSVLLVLTIASCACCVQGTRVTLDRIFIRGKRIRYVHIPDSVNVATTLTNHLAVLDKAANKYKRGVRKGSGRRMDKARP